MNEYLVTAAVSVITAVLSYMAGAKKSTADATQVIGVAYNFALESLRKDFEERMQTLKDENKQLKNEIAELREKLAFVLNSRINLRGVQSEEGTDENRNAGDSNI